MRAVVIVHERDIFQVNERVFEDGTTVLSQRLFPLEAHTFDVIVFKPTSSQPAFVDAEGERIPVTQLAQRTSTWILIAGDHASTSRPLIEEIRNFLRGAHRSASSWNNEALVVLSFSDRAREALASLPVSRVFHLPDHADVSTRGTLPIEDSTNAGDVKSILDAIAENQTQNPNLGFGLLLVNADGKFFLMERLRQPGHHKLGTIGGNFLRGRSVQEQLDETLKRRFRSGSTPHLQLGPLLACTSMQNEFYHYVDLTFLAMTDQRLALNGVSDPELRPVSVPTLVRLNAALEDDSGKTAPRYMFTLDEMAWFHRSGLLFQPVANAFESFCRKVVAVEVIDGPQASVRLPALFSRDGPLEVPLAVRGGEVRSVLDSFSKSSRTALPFYEGPL
ncbi:hypothetical protein EV652_12654 [Kribbella steppae]|uniref:Uncharacterized protein n=1 Tax=Kribbella steppae TaxID=2512223 RepID=A0A4R2GT15_9ACTN|nr:hypothetical protein [Kribbella steppae]TCO13513.1 hypothetical protein EV652_12654 [Kribbella steppae]